MESRPFGFPCFPFLGISKAYLFWRLHEPSLLTTTAFLGNFR